MIERREVLARYAMEAQGDWSETARMIRTGAPVPSVLIQDSYLTIFDEAYPTSLRQLRFPPWVLFYQGNLDLLKQSGMTVVGSRNMNEYARSMTQAVTARLSDRFVIISGLAKGVDACAHSEAISHQGKTIGVIGSGLKTHYPSVNERLYRRMAVDQLILSEYPWQVGVRREHFPWRNRILAALGQAVIVTQANVRSGTMLTVNEAITLSKDIYCIPYPTGDESGSGCDLLIQQGANILYDLSMLDDLQPEQIGELRLQNRTDVAYPNCCLNKQSSGGM